MRTSNLSSQSIRQSETGLTWEEALTNAQGTLNILPHSTFRVRATGATTVTIDGILAMTMSTGEIAIFNAGSGVTDINSGKRATAAVIVIAGANAFVQIARENTR